MVCNMTVSIYLFQKNKENPVLPWYSTSPLLKSTNHAVVLIIYIIWMVFLISCDGLTVFHLIDSLHPLPSAHGSPLGSVLEHRNSSSGLGLLEKHLSRAGVRLHLSDGRRRGHICTTGETLHNTQWDNCTLTAYARLYGFVLQHHFYKRKIWAIVLHFIEQSLQLQVIQKYNTSKAKSTQTLNVNMIFYCHKWLCLFWDQYRETDQLGSRWTLWIRSRSHWRQNSCSCQSRSETLAWPGTDQENALTSSLYLSIYLSNMHFITAVSLDVYLLLTAFSLC